MKSSGSPSSDSPEAQGEPSYIEEEYASSPLLEAEEDSEHLRLAKLASKSSNTKPKRKGARETTSRRRRINSDSSSDFEVDIETYKFSSSSKSNPREDSFSASDQEIKTFSKPLTKRQKAKYFDEYTEELQELKEESRKKHLTEEELALRRSETARKRKHQSQQKAEKDKIETINRLLKKQASKKSRADQQKESHQDLERPASPPKFIRYISSSGGSTLSFPEEALHLLEEFKQVANYPPTKPLCMVENCNKPTKYRHPKTQKVSCSLDHYRLLSCDSGEL